MLARRILQCCKQYSEAYVFLDQPDAQEQGHGGMTQATGIAQSSYRQMTPSCLFPRIERIAPPCLYVCLPFYPLYGKLIIVALEKGKLRKRCFPRAKQVDNMLDKMQHGCVEIEFEMLLRRRWHIRKGFRL